MPKAPRPKVLGDVFAPNESAFRERRFRINLSFRARGCRIAVGRFLHTAVSVCALWLLIVGEVAAPTVYTLAANPSTSEEERRALESQLKELEGQIDQYEDQVAGYKKQGATLTGEIGRLNNKIAKLNLQIRAIDLTLRELDGKIEETQEQIEVTEESIESNRGALANLVQNLYRSDRMSLVEIFLKNPKLSDFFGDVNNITLLQNNLRLTIAKITDLKEQLQDQKDQYALAHADAATIKEYQAVQRTEADKVKSEKNNLLSVTKGQESKYAALLRQTKETAAQIRSRIFQLLGGGELSFEEAYRYAKLASSATGVRPALILAVLDRESALGQNVGRCSYKTAMSPGVPPRPNRRDDISIFLRITLELGIDPDSVTVSCSNRDGVFGGAMGPAQFIPSTWQLYRNAISKVTGRTPPSPWNNGDAFVATALYLQDVGATRGTVADERQAAARYYAGSKWRSYLWSYGEAVISRAKKFQEDIATINS